MCYFLKRRFPAPGQTNAVTQEVFQVMLSALQARANVSPLVAGELNQLYAHIRNAQVSFVDYLSSCCLRHKALKAKLFCVQIVHATRYLSANCDTPLRLRNFR